MLCFIVQGLCGLNKSISVVLARALDDIWQKPLPSIVVLCDVTMWMCEDMGMGQTEKPLQPLALDNRFLVYKALKAIIPTTNNLFFLSYELTSLLYWLRALSLFCIWKRKCLWASKCRLYPLRTHLWLLASGVWKQNPSMVPQPLGGEWTHFAGDSRERGELLSAGADGLVFLVCS